MVRFEKDKIVIEIETKFPTNQWLDDIRDIVHVISVINKDMVDNDNDCIYSLCSLLLEMLPDEKQARRLLAGSPCCE